MIQSSLRITDITSVGPLHIWANKWTSCATSRFVIGSIMDMWQPAIQISQKNGKIRCIALPCSTSPPGLIQMRYYCVRIYLLSTGGRMDTLEEVLHLRVKVWAPCNFCGTSVALVTVSPYLATCVELLHRLLMHRWDHTVDLIETMRGNLIAEPHEFWSACNCL